MSPRTVSQVYLHANLRVILRSWGGWEELTPTLDKEAVSGSSVRMLIARQMRGLSGVRRGKHSWIGYESCKNLTSDSRNKLRGVGTGATLPLSELTRASGGFCIRQVYHEGVSRFSSL